MRDLAILIIAEQKTLLRGLLFSFFVVLPFTFLPAIAKYGFSIQNISRQLSDSVFYALCLALVVEIAAIIQNYNSLVERKRLFDKPAITLSMPKQALARGSFEMGCLLGFLSPRSMRGAIKPSYL